MRVTVRDANPEDAAPLSRLAHAAKAHWGYPRRWLDIWSDELMITPAYLATHHGFVATHEQEVVGVCVLADRQDHWMLEHVWVRPDTHRKGVGRALLLHALRAAHELRPGRVQVLSDPFAAPFYIRMGAVQIGEVSAPMPEAPNRTLPLLELATAAA